MVDFRFRTLDFGLPPLRNSQHLFVEIQSDRLRAATGQRERQIARAAADVEGLVAGPHAGQFDDPPFPVAVEAEALQIVNQVVMRGDRGEELIHLLGSLQARSEEFVSHNLKGGAPTAIHRERVP